MEGSRDGGDCERGEGVCRSLGRPKDLVEDGVVFAELVDGLLIVLGGGVAGTVAVLHDQGFLNGEVVESA